jgi:hypothetical protein
MRRVLGLSALALLLGITGANAQHRNYPARSHHEIGGPKNGGTWYYAPRYEQDTADRRLFGPEGNGG